MRVKEKFEFKSKLLKKVREEQKLSQDYLAKQIFTTRQSISNWENGKKMPTLENIEKLSRLLEIPMEDLVIRPGKEEKKTNDERLENTNNPDVCVVDNTTIKRGLKDLKIIKIFVIVILILLLIYIGSSIRKFCILNSIKDKILTYENVNNYSYIKTYYETNNVDCVINYTEHVFHKDGISKSKHYDGENIDILYIENDKAMLIHEKTKEYENLELYELTSINNLLKNVIPDSVNTNELINFLHAINPFFTIKIAENDYIIKYNVNILKNRYIIEHIGNDGLLNEKIVHQSEEQYQKIIYEAKINNVTENDIKVNYEEYNVKK